MVLYRDAKLSCNSQLAILVLSAGVVGESCENMVWTYVKDWVVFSFILDIRIIPGAFVECSIVSSAIVNIFEVIIVVGVLLV